MAMRDLKNRAYSVKLLVPADTTEDTWSSYLDLKGLQGVKIVVTNGVLGDGSGSNYFTPVLYEADDGETATSSASYSAVDSGDIEGAFIAVADGTTTLTQYVGYKGSGRYIAVKLDETGTVTSSYWSVTAECAYGRRLPITTAPTTGTIT